MTAWLVHLYTASGLVLALLAVQATLANDYRLALAWLWLQVVIDATDGALARRFRVSARLPAFDGAHLDDLVDYATFVFVPALMVWRAGVVPPSWAMPVASAMLVSSALGFSRVDAKTADHFFTGFPSYWNVVVLYLLVFHWAPVTNAVLLCTLAALVLVPVRYVYPSRTPVLRTLTNVLGAAWSALVLLMLWWYPDVPPALLWASLVFPVYYLGLSLALHVTRPRAPSIHA